MGPERRVVDLRADRGGRVGQVVWQFKAGDVREGAVAAREFGDSEPWLSGPVGDAHCFDAEIARDVFLLTLNHGELDAGRHAKWDLDHTWAHDESVLSDRGERCFTG